MFEEVAVNAPTNLKNELKPQIPLHLSIKVNEIETNEKYFSTIKK